MHRWVEACIPSIVATFRVISHIIKQTTKIDENGARDVRGDEMGLHLLWGSIWGDGD